MGSRNVHLVAEVHAGLPAVAYKLLVWMALASLDEPRRGKPACLYYGGTEASCRAIGHPIDATSTPGDRRAAERAMHRALATLVARGIVERVEKSAPGRRASYRLHLAVAPGPPGQSGGPTQSSTSDTQRHPSAEWTSDVTRHPFEDATPDDARHVFGLPPTATGDVAGSQRVSPGVAPTSKTLKRHRHPPWGTSPDDRVWLSDTPIRMPSRAGADPWCAS